MTPSQLELSIEQNQESTREHFWWVRLIATYPRSLIGEPRGSLSSRQSAGPQAPSFYGQHDVG